ncbi:C40 family peptidase [Vogesella oryzae]|uniref:C40 family peptidase n=1 Tax=Vogesella oryzae TaxID=1735285 RepID=UPI0015822768|nr:C40 family peptidase [Vogesella oryzae]
MKFHQYLLACVLAACMALANAAPDKSADSRTADESADPIARFASPGEEAAGDLLLQAMSLLGVAYRFGGSNPETGLDCSGFIQYVFKKSLHVNLPRTAAEMAQVGREVSRDELKPGDLVFFNTRGFRYSHVGIFLGNNKFIHSPRTGKSVEVGNMSQSYWVSRYNGARRVARGTQLAAADDAAVTTAKRPDTAVAAKTAGAVAKRSAKGTVKTSAKTKGKAKSSKSEAASKKTRGKSTAPASKKKRPVKKH